MFPDGSEKGQQFIVCARQDIDINGFFFGNGPLKTALGMKPVWRMY